MLPFFSIKTDSLLKNFTIVGTNLKKRLTRGDPGINPLDAACKEHDIAYTENSSERRTADKKLQKEAMKRVFATDSSFGERLTALGVSAAMKAKRMLTKKGGGIPKKRRIGKTKTSQISLHDIIRGAKSEIKNMRPNTIDSAVKVAIKAAKKAKGRKHIKTPRIIKVPSFSGGVLPLIPIFAGLSAIGSITATTAGIVNAINQYEKAQNDLDESKRHNKMMEAIALGNKTGEGYFLHPAKSGDGYYLAPNPKNV